MYQELSRWETRLQQFKWIRGFREGIWFNAMAFLWIKIWAGDKSKLGSFMLTKHEAPSHDDVIKWKHFSRYWPFVWEIHWSPVNSPHKGEWRGALMFSFICARMNGWVNNHEAGDLRRHRAHYDITVMVLIWFLYLCTTEYECFTCI